MKKYRAYGLSGAVIEDHVMPGLFTRNKRKAPRHANVTGSLPGTLIRRGTEDRPTSARVVDVSEDGLGITCDRPLDPGDRIWLMLPDRGIRFEVRHCREDQRAPGSYRCGLASSAPWENLVKLFSSHECIEPSERP